MSRIALFATVGFAFLLAVSIGVGQPLPRSIPNAVPPAHYPSGSPAGNVFQGLSSPSGATPPVLYPPPVAVVPYVPGEKMTAVPGEKMTVKVYSVPDLVATVQAHHAAPNPFGGSPELAQVMQQIQLQVAAAQASVQSALPTEPSEEVTMKLERLKKALLVAAPKKSWEEGGGEGEIEVYSEALCLIVRQTASGHEAITDLLSQLRATQDVQIELAVEMVTFDGVADDLAGKAMQFLNKDLSPEELAQFRKCGAKTGASSVVRIINGRSANASLSPGMPIQFTAVASADRSIVEFRADVAVPMGEDNGTMLQAFSHSRTVLAGKTLAYMMGPDGTIVLLVTPTVVDRQPAVAKSPQRY